MGNNRTQLANVQELVEFDHIRRFRDYFNSVHYFDALELVAHALSLLDFYTQHNTNIAVALDEFGAAFWHAIETLPHSLDELTPEGLEITLRLEELAAPIISELGFGPDYPIT